MNLDTILPLLFFFALVLLPALWAIVTYNRLVALRNHCSEAWSNIDTELKRRYELIPNLVATVKGYAAHEREVLEEVTRLRTAAAAGASTPGAQAVTENQLVEALNRLAVRIEAYPELKANEHFLELQRELSHTEDRIQAARRFYNGNVRENNNLIEMFPSKVIAAAGNFTKKDFFEVESTAFRQVPSVAAKLH